MDGDSLPVSAFVDSRRRPVRAGRCRLREARRVPSPLPTWDADEVHPVQQLLVRLPARHHPSLRSDRRGGRRRLPPLPRSCTSRPARARASTSTRMAVSPLDCMGCGVCVGAVPRRRADHGWPPKSEAGPAGRVRLLRGQGRPTRPTIAGQHRQGQPVQAAAAGVLRLLRRLRRDQLRASRHPALRRPHVHLQRHRLLLHLGRSCRLPLPTRINKDGHGPAWCNSLFEDNAEHGLGMYAWPRGCARQRVG